MPKPQPDLEAFAAALRGYMAFRGLGPGPLSELIGPSRQAVSDWMWAKSSPSSANLAELEQALGLPSGELSQWLRAELRSTSPAGFVVRPAALTEATEDWLTEQSDQAEE